MIVETSMDQDKFEMDIDSCQIKEKIGYNICKVAMSSLMLLGSLYMGLTISSLSNDEFIKRDFFNMHYNKNSIPIEKITSEHFPATIWSLGFLFPFGGWFGSLLAASTVDKFGRKKTSLFFCLIGIIGALLKIFSKYTHIALLFSGRFCDGIAASGMMVSVILLMFETLPNKIGGIFKPIIQISVNFGIFLMSCLSMYAVVGKDWNYVHISTLIIIIILTVAIILLPESPKFILISENNPKKAEKALKKLRGNSYVSSELEEMMKTVNENFSTKKMSILEFLIEPRFRLATISLIILHLGQQLSGINSIMAFAPSFFKDSGFNSPDIPGVIVISIGLIGSIIFAPIVGNFKRKNLWMIGFILMTVSFSGFLIVDAFGLSSIYKLVCLSMFVFVFQLGPGPVCWFISVEMFPASANGAAQGVASFFNWFANTVVFWLFPILEAKLKYNVLIIFIVVQIIVILYSALFVVETLNKTPNDVLDEYQMKIKF